MPLTTQPSAAPALALEAQDIDREIAERQRVQAAALAAEGVEVRETLRNGRVEVTRVRLSAYDQVPQQFKDAVSRAEADEQQARIARASAKQRIEQYIQYNGLPGQPARWLDGNDGTVRPSGKSPADSYYDQEIAPFNKAVARAEERVARAKDRLGEQVKAYTNLERVRTRIEGEQRDDDAAYEQRRARRQAELMAAELRCMR